MVTFKRVSSTADDAWSMQFVDDNAQVVHYDVRIKCHKDNGDVLGDLLEFTEDNMYANKEDAEKAAGVLFHNNLRDQGPYREFPVVACMIPTLREHDVMVQRTWDYHCNNHPGQTTSVMKTPPVKGEIVAGYTNIDPRDWRKGFRASVFFYNTTTHETIIVWECDHSHKNDGGILSGLHAAEKCSEAYAKEQGIEVG